MTEERFDAATRQLERAIARLRASVMAVVFGAAGGALIFLATVWLVVRGGRVVGPHLALLGQYFPGYRVTLPGAFIGFAYGALCGAVAGWLVAWLYNLVVDMRRRAS